MALVTPRLGKQNMSARDGRDARWTRRRSVPRTTVTMVYSVQES